MDDLTTVAFHALRERLAVRQLLRRGATPLAGGTGALAIPVVFHTQADKTDPVANLDTDLQTIADYINAHEVTFGLFANRPAPGTHGAAYYATDIGGGTLYLDTGVAWLSVSSAIAVGTLASRPAAGTAGRSYLASDIGTYGAVFIDNGAAWVLQPSVVDRAFAVTIANTAAETTIYSKSYVANALPTTGRFRVSILGKISDTRVTATTDTFTVRCKLGATTLLSYAQVVGAVDNTCPCGIKRTIGATQRWRMVFEVGNLNVANSQVGEAVFDTVGLLLGLTSTFVITGESAGGGNPGATQEAHATKRGTSAIDTTAAATLAVTGQWSSADANESYTADSILVEML